MQRKRRLCVDERSLRVCEVNGECMTTDVITGVNMFHWATNIPQVNSAPPSPRPLSAATPTPSPADAVLLNSTPHFTSTLQRRSDQPNRSHDPMRDYSFTAGQWHVHRCPGANTRLLTATLQIRGRTKEQQLIKFQRDTPCFHYFICWWRRRLRYFQIVLDQVVQKYLHKYISIKIQNIYLFPITW